ncbi:hypothetical protein FNW52_10425 [Flavobacterium sp. ZT3R18]|uniref:hypothetical protein n=1 Tax=Flavobacterium sp. ZT3R18 TaxID=2594429 RepID=UPI0011799E4E|nr:hypothetical protein [Flavobacterium sp. ZT3R18]TRX35451.1 hypothetical protein FNW52_10425 [Flavobacterium sp. ZT3R18]
MIDKKNIYWLIAGIINLFTAVLHTIGGQISLVNPLLGSNLIIQAKAEWMGAWHMVTIILFATSYLLIKNGLGKKENEQTEFVKYIGYLYILFSVPSIVTSVMYNLLAPQWIILLPIGLLAYLGKK